MNQTLRPQIAFQLKATTLLAEDESLGAYRFPCPVKNYEKLIIATQVPRLLLVYKMPKEESRWIEFLEEEALLRHCAYWVNLKGLPDPTQSTSITIDVPKSHKLTVDELRRLMDCSRKGQL